MIVGEESMNLEAMVQLYVYGDSGKKVTIRAAIDTGFDGALSLNSKLIGELQLPQILRHVGTLADGTEHEFNVHQGKVEWNGEERFIEIDALEGEPLIGTQLLRRHRLTIDFVFRGEIEIQRLP